MLANPFFRISSFLECDLKTGSQNITCSFNISCSPRSCGICCPTPEANYKAFEENNDGDFVLRSLCWLFSLSTQFPPDQVAQPCQVQTFRVHLLEKKFVEPQEFFGNPSIYFEHALSACYIDWARSINLLLTWVLLLQLEKSNIKLPST